MTKQARIIKGVGGQYWLHNQDEDFFGIATARGIFRKAGGLTPMAGDWVEYSTSGDPDVPWRIDAILPRHNILIRPPLANLDCLIITLAATEPAADFNLVDKLLTVCFLHAIEPVIVITKTDLLLPADSSAESAPALAGTGSSSSPVSPAKIMAVYASVGCRIIQTNPQDETSHTELRDLMRGHIVSFAGQSGVGKSTLLNQLFGVERMATGVISQRIGRGRHTTRHVELFPFGGGYMADTPGFSTLELKDLGVSGPELVRGYPEIEAVEDQCRFTGCRHLGELGCAVETQATIHPERLQRYRSFRDQLDRINPYSGHKPRTNPKYHGR